MSATWNSNGSPCATTISSGRSPSDTNVYLGTSRHGARNRAHALTDAGRIPRNRPPASAASRPAISTRRRRELGDTVRARSRSRVNSATWPIAAATSLGDRACSDGLAASWIALSSGSPMRGWVRARSRASWSGVRRRHTQRRKASGIAPHATNAAMSNSPRNAGGESKKRSARNTSRNPSSTPVAAAASASPSFTVQSRRR